MIGKTKFCKDFYRTERDYQRFKTAQYAALYQAITASQVALSARRYRLQGALRGWFEAFAQSDFYNIGRAQGGSTE